MPEPAATVMLAAEADGQIGFGHAARCASLHTALASRGIPTALRIRASDEATGWLASRQVAFERVPRRRALFRSLREAGAPPVLVVTDLLHTSKRTVDAWRAAGADWVVQINDSGSFAVGADAYVDVDATRLDLSRPPDAPIASGFEFALVHEAVRQARPLSSVELAGQPRLLLTCGGADPGCVTESVVDALDRWRGGTLTVLCGAGWTCARRDAMHRRARAGRLVLDAQPSLIARMLEHDVVVTIGGATALEACCLGRSVVVVPWAHLARHAARMARLGLAHVVEPRGLRRLLADADALRRRARAGFEAVDGRGAERIIDFLLKRLPSEGDPR